MAIKLNEITRETLFKNKRFFEGAFNALGFFLAIPLKVISIVASDLYEYRDFLPWGNFLELMTELPSGLFKDSKLVEIEIPKNILKIGDDCFAGSTLTKCDIKAPIVTIPFRCFKDCHDLKDLYLPDTVIEIKLNAFENCNEQVKIHCKRTGRRISSTSGLLQFLLNHLVDDLPEDEGDI